eukprot:jgi/Botrbrau1/10362/Bobra.146_2s0001.1
MGQNHERPVIHVRDERETVSEQTDTGPSELSCLGGTCSVPESNVSCEYTMDRPPDIPEVRGQYGASHTSEGHVRESATGPAPQSSCMVSERKRARERHRHTSLTVLYVRELVRLKFTRHVRVRQRRRIGSLDNVREHRITRAFREVPVSGKKM